MQIVVKQRGDLNHIEKFLRKMKQHNYYEKIDKYGRMGVEALSAATPVRTGKTASSWVYEVGQFENGIKITWLNTNVVNGWANVAILIQYGHGTRNGGYVQGIDYINPALKPVFENIANDLWVEVTSA